jgi:hypothetical protein
VTFLSCPVNILLLIIFKEGNRRAVDSWCIGTDLQSRADQMTVVLAGSSGESATLSVEEKGMLVKRARVLVGGLNLDQDVAGGASQTAHSDSEISLSMGISDLL